MYRLTIMIFLFSSLCFGCQSQQIQSIDSDIFGYWICQEYIQEIKNTHDPFVSIKNVPYKILIIEEKEQSGDTIKISFDEPQRSEFSGFNYYKMSPDCSLVYIGYSFWNPADIKYNDSQSHIIAYDKTDDQLMVRDLTGKVKIYSRIPDFEVGKYHENLKRLIAKLLFSDKYTFNEKIVEFIDDGRIIGFEDYNSFRLGINYSFDFSLYTANYIELFKTPTPGKWSSATENLNNRFSFDFDSDTLKLYEIREEILDEYQIVKGQLRYKLIKYAP